MEAECSFDFFSLLAFAILLLGYFNHRCRRNLRVFLVKIQVNSNISSSSALNLQLPRAAGGR